MHCPCHCPDIVDAPDRLEYPSTYLLTLTHSHRTCWLLIWFRRVSCWLQYSVSDVRPTHEMSPLDSVFSLEPVSSAKLLWNYKSNQAFVRCLEMQFSALGCQLALFRPAANDMIIRLRNPRLQFVALTLKALCIRQMAATSLVDNLPLPLAYAGVSRPRVATIPPPPPPPKTILDLPVW